MSKFKDGQEQSNVVQVEEEERLQLSENCRSGKGEKGLERESPK